MVEKATGNNTLLSVFVGIILVVSLFTAYNSMQLNSKIDSILELADAAPSAPSQPKPSAPVKVSADDDAVKGDADAPVTIIEFSDYECPFCGRFFTQTLPQIEEKYIKTGKVKLVYRDFPLAFHPNAQKAAEAAECAGEQGQYYPYHDKLFENQQALSIDNLKSYAVDLGLDVEAFNSCLDSGKMADEVKKDYQEGQAAGVTGTPAFFVNGQKLVGAQPFQVFEQLIEAELAK